MRQTTTHSSSIHRDQVSLAQVTGGDTSASQWSFVYCFFSNNMPFSAPNRSEPCPGSC